MDQTAAAASATTARPSFNVGFFASPAGWFKILEIVLGTLVFALIAGGGQGHYSSAMQFVLFVSITCWILTLALFVIYMFAIQSTVLAGAPWDMIEFGFNVTWSVMYFIAACVAAAFTYGYDYYVAATVFAFFITVTYICHSVYAYRTWRGEIPCLPSDTGTNVNT